jgi:hypothetical protein
VLILKPVSHLVAVAVVTKALHAKMGNDLRFSVIALQRSCLKRRLLFCDEVQKHFKKQQIY